MRIRLVARNEALIILLLTCSFFSILFSFYSDVSRTSQEAASYRWANSDTLVFDTQSNWGCPKALSLKVSSMSKYKDNEEGSHHDQLDLGCGFVDLCSVWGQGGQVLSGSSSIETRTQLFLYNSSEEFDQHGQALESESRDEVSCH